MIESEARSRPFAGRAVLIAVGIVGLAVAVIIAAMALGSSSSSGGAGSPEEAVEQLLESLSREDAIGAAEVLLPSERDALADPLFDIVEQLQRLEILADDLDLNAVTGIDVEFEDVTLVVESVHDDLAVVDATGGAVSGSYAVADLPLGRLLLDRLPRSVLTSRGSDVNPINPDEGSPIAVVREGGRWFVSLWYSVAEAGRRDAGLPPPDLSQRLIARGAESPEDAVRAMVDALVALDIERAFQLLPPDEARALHDYYPLFEAELRSASSDARRSLNDAADISIDRLDLSSKPHRGGQLVAIAGFAASVVTDEIAVDVDVGAGRAEVIIEDAFGFSLEMTFADGCATFTSRNSGQPPDTESFCADDVGQQLDELFGFGEFPDFNIFVKTPDLGIKTVEVDGEWYVSPLGTLLESQVDVLAAIDQQKLEDVIDFFIDLSEQDSPF